MFCCANAADERSAEIVRTEQVSSTAVGVPDLEMLKPSPASPPPADLSLASAVVITEKEATLPEEPKEEESTNASKSDPVSKEPSKPEEAEKEPERQAAEPEEVKVPEVKELERQPEPEEAAAPQPVPALPAATQAAEPVESGIRLGCNQGSVLITRRPVDIEFDTTKSPAKVLAVAGHGAEIGLQVGWVIETLAGQPVDTDPQVFYHSFLCCLNGLPGDFRLPLLFKKPNGQMKTVVVPRAPLGMSLTKQLPTTVATSNELSLQLGIMPGWTLLRYGDKLVSDFSDWGVFFADFKSIVAQLPQQ